eukprot:COSAG01_NODE_4632_length_4861_cov_2.222596_2_plen_105_part_00
MRRSGRSSEHVVVERVAGVNEAERVRTCVLPFCALAAVRIGVPHGERASAGTYIDAPCPQRLRHGDPMHAQERLTARSASLPAASSAPMHCGGRTGHAMSTNVW